MKVLITGGAGFIGYHLAKRLLADGCEVVIADNFSRGVEDTFLKELAKKGRITFKNTDLMDEKNALELGDDYDRIYHLAAIIGVQIVLDHSYDVLKKNVCLLLNMIELAKKQKHLSRFLFASTSEIYAGTLKYYGLDIPTPETTPLTITPLEEKRTSYMLSKIYGEALLRQSGIPFTIFRPHNFYGPRMGMSHVIPELLRKVYNDEGNGKLEVYSVEHKRTFCYIDDAVEMIVRLADSEKACGEAYNIGNESPEISIMEVARTVLKTVGREYEIIPLPPSPGSPERRCPSMEKTGECTGYTPAVTLEEGIKRTFEWYRANIFDGNEVCEK
ncbi:MAG: NAD-dependent epimerase/dehydratase family protein [Lachnospiraceae bacterium]|nr:NAD-dependent epimerase/dehydratase family protein [Lachnospiraceae bacterium]